LKRTRLLVPALSALALALALAVMLAACGSSSPTPAATVTVTASPTSPTASPSSAAYTGMPTASVIKLQKGLAAAGLYSGPIDGVYGPATEAAVKQAQVKLGVPPDGIWGPSTSKAYQAYVQQHGGGKHPDAFVMQMQVDLADLGYYTGKVDGYYGPGTEAAVKAFQKDNGLPVTGELDSATVNAINRAVTQTGATVALGGPASVSLGSQVTLKVTVTNSAGYSGASTVQFLQQQGSGWKGLGGVNIVWQGSKSGSASLTLTSSGGSSSAFVYKATWQHENGPTTSNQLTVTRTN